VSKITHAILILKKHFLKKKLLFFHDKCKVFVNKEKKKKKKFHDVGRSFFVLSHRTKKYDLHFHFLHTKKR